MHPEPVRHGYSVARWDGDTLLVETSGLIDEGWLDIIANPLTDAAKVTERFRRSNFANLEIEITVDDPKRIPNHGPLPLGNRSS
jgi:hypothetical protein